ncbi:protease Do [Rhodosalinus halophilus]|uniref:Probable periplasmic serine endoprotease DegP-like n=1 Tax=Rhodosalinus halophilus TaxID=2259333 RepID=A0A365UB44_9RHOB|nr:Do family serine endopeptidase [Rhodosalinus halophilus]RBI86369.1 protease Do [Rhodosalinus halophilus]
MPDFVLRRPKSAAALVALFAAAQPLAAQQSVQGTAPGADYDTPAGFQEMVADKLPAVVGILSTAPARAGGPERGPRLPPGFEDFFGAPMPQQPPGPMRAQGSGFFVSADGYVVTNNHVVQGAESVEVVLADEERLEAAIVGTDPATDLALLKVETDETRPFVTWGASSDLQVGEWLVAIGNPFGLRATVTAGILSARSRDIRSGPYDDFLQTDAAINSGNSGGPLFNTEGDVVGVNTAIFSPSGGNVGIGFAIPSRVAQSVVADLRDDGEVERGYLGVRLQPVDANLAAALGLPEDAPGGALIADVTEGSPAAEAGLRPGDVVTQIAGEPIEDPRALSFAVAALEAGSEVGVSVLREGEPERLEVTIGEQPAEFFAAAAPPQTPQDDGQARLGVTVAPVDGELRARSNLPDTVSGLYVVSVAPGTPAARAGLREGDVISTADGEEIEGVEALRAAARAAEESERPLLLRVFRGGSHSFVAVRLDDGDQS